MSKRAAQLRQNNLHSFDDLANRMLLAAQFVDLEKTNLPVAVAGLYVVPRVGENIVIDGQESYITAEVGEVTHVFSHHSHTNQTVMVGLYKVIRRLKGGHDGEVDGGSKLDEPVAAGLEPDARPLAG